MSISAEQVRELREKTGAGLMDCKRALVESGGDQKEAVRLLREKGLAKAKKKGARETAEGVVQSYIHANGKLGVLMEVACETDFVARNQEFRSLVKDLCMQVAAMNPLAVSREDLPESTIEEEKEVYARQFEGKPPHVLEKILAGKLESYFAEACLLDQPFIKDDSRKVGDLINDAIAKMGENIRVRRFVKMELGGVE